MPSIILCHIIFERVVRIVEKNELQISHPRPDFLWVWLTICAGPKEVTHIPEKNTFDKWALNKDLVMLYLSLQNNGKILEILFCQKEDKTVAWTFCCEY